MRRSNGTPRGSRKENRPDASDRPSLTSSEPFRLYFDAPLNPDPENLLFLLVDLDDRSTDPAGLPLGLNVSLLENERDRSVVEVWPSGILPFEHLLSLEAPHPLASLSDLVGKLEGSTIATTFTTAAAPGCTSFDSSLLANRTNASPK